MTSYRAHQYTAYVRANALRERDEFNLGGKTLHVDTAEELNDYWTEVTARAFTDAATGRLVVLRVPSDMTFVVWRDTKVTTPEFE
jgi:hypothetical protein